MKSFLKTLLASAVIGFGLMGSALAAAPEGYVDPKAQCMSSDEVWAKNQVEAKSTGITLDHVTLKGEDAKKVRDYLNKKFEGKALPFDEVTFITNKLDQTAPVLMIIYNEGCVVAGGPISPEEFIEVVVQVTGDQNTFKPKKTADPEVINPDTKGI
jgi:hypothetical protein